MIIAENKILAKKDTQAYLTYAAYKVRHSEAKKFTVTIIITEIAK